uniref:Uncharacterized protein n=1 Tax=Cacopsylla melanoneura TaxID=428564 RepID=A0A8D8XY07_9HEMI
MIKRNCKFMTDLDALIQLFTSLVRSKLEYGAVLWSPDTSSWVHKLEIVQCRFIKYLFYKENKFYPSYPECISYLSLVESLDMLTLNSRRIIQGLILLHKLISGQLHCPELLSKINFHVPQLRTRTLNNTKLFEIKPKNVISGLDTILKNYNDLILENPNIDITENLENFVKKVKSFYSSKQGSVAW